MTELKGQLRRYAEAVLDGVPAIPLAEVRNHRPSHRGGVLKSHRVRGPSIAVLLAAIVALVAMVAMTGTTSPSHNGNPASGRNGNPASGQNIYHGAGWSIRVPHGWHVLRFNASKDGVSAVGVQLSNVRLPRPAIIHGFPIQVNGRVLPPRGIALIVATDDDPTLSHGRVVALPASPRDWSTGSATAGQPYVMYLWFRTAGGVFLASAKVGAHASSAAQKALASASRSLTSSGK
ncbi:MAG: hypothetical protein ACYCSF_09105 [Acidimicrobiales bacterium]